MIKRVNENLVKITSTVLISALVLTGCGAGGNTVAKVNGEKVSVEEYTKDYEIIKQRYESELGAEYFDEAGPDGKTMEDVLKERVLDKLVIETIIMQKAKDDNVLATDKEIEDQTKNFKEMVGGEEGFNNFLKGNNMTEEYFKSGIKKELTVEKYRDNYIESLKIDDKKLKEYYEENKAAYEVVEASHILVDTEEEAKAIKSELDAGGDFGELAKKSIEPGAAERKGELGYFPRGKMIPEFEKAAFALKVGEISGPVKTEYQPGKFGYHIIKVTNKKDSFDQVKEEVKAQLESAKFEEKLLSLKEEAKVKTYMENTKSVGKKDDKEKKDDVKKDDVKKDDKKAEENKK